MDTLIRRGFAGAQYGVACFSMALALAWGAVLVGSQPAAAEPRLETPVSGAIAQDTT